MSATMTEIAEEVGVSRATVSYVLNGREDQSISPATRRAVAEVAERLGYRPNRLARAMVTARTHTFGAVVTRLPGTWHAHLVEAIEDTAYQHDCSVLLGCSHWNPVRERRLVETFLEYRVDGVLVLPYFDANASWYQGLVEEGEGIIFMVAKSAGVRADGVFVDNHRAGYLVGQHLASLGRKHFAIIWPPVTNYSDDEGRLDGFVAATHDCGLEPPHVLEVAPAADWTGAYEAMAECLHSGPPVDAVFSFTDYLALDAMRAIQDSGRSVPDDVAVVGYDDIAEAANAVPPLTTVRAPIREIGEQAVEMLLRRTQTGEAPCAPQRIFLEPTLVVRESTVGLKAQHSFRR